MRSSAKETNVELSSFSLFLFWVVFLTILVNLFYAVIISIYFGKIKWLLLLLLIK